MAWKFKSGLALTVQIVDKLRADILKGEYVSGGQFPTVRQLAYDAGVNPNTMQKALVELEDDKLIYTERTNGKFVTDDKKLLKKFREELAKEKVITFVDDMKFIGFSKEEIIEYLRKVG